MMNQTRLVKKHTPGNMTPEYVLNMLGKHFKVSTLEKYDSAILQILFNNGMKKYQKRQRVGEHLLQKTQKYMNDRLRKMYGPYISVLRKKERFLCNFSMVYKTDQGRLYQSSSIPDLFITSHALERYEQRMPDLNSLDLTAGMNVAFRNTWGTSPTAFDSMDNMLAVAREYGIPIKQGDTIILNLVFGFLVLDVFENFSIGKTFLTPDMNVPECEWFKKEGKIKTVDATILDMSESIDIPFMFAFMDGDWKVSRKFW